MASSLFNGERAVVLLFITKVLLSSSISLFAEGFALFLLALSALTVEISFQNPICLSSLSDRPGVSSGILVGAVTLPAVFMSRLIQLLRAVSLHEIGISDLEYLKAQYWVVYYCCTSLIFSVISIYGKPCRNSRDMFIFTCGVLSTFACFLSFASQSHSSWYGALKLIWVLLHGLVATKLLHHISRTFPSCASVGEVFLVTSGLVLYFGDMLTLTLIQRYFTSPQLFFEQFSNRSEISIINQGLILGVLLCPAAYKSVIQSLEYACKFTSCGKKINSEITRSFIFYTLIAFVLILAAPSWMKFVHDFQSHPFLWVFEFIFSDPLKRVILCVYWVGIIYVSVFRFYNVSKNSKTERILLRKYYHLMAVIMFLPALIFQLKFLYLALGVALVSFLVLEIVRVWRIWPMGHLLHRFMNAFTDHRDSDLLIISHFSLLVGCALPIWMSYGYTDRPLASFSGILSLGIGDTMASIVGHKYGVLRWSKTGKKTIEGTAAGITSVILACSVILPILAATGYICTQGWFSLVMAVTLSGLLEAYTTQLDNAFIPLVFYSLLCL